ncbi:uncharacterized protein LOC132193630 [Neocloeon triangulifer]|uniref:uncharacterized protein LOC132193630 n=1 Tax=Neocloeon triangulifer TaxID=2078957 RepID=UPI00286EE6B4|nr:uncharacterized protein LOC132193630 [Neocloeon triangulifer]
MAEGEGEFGFVSRDQGLLDRAAGRPDVEEGETTAASAPPEEQSGSTAGSDSPAGSKRGSVASISSSIKNEMDLEQANATDVALPQVFQVKYLGRKEARGLWGIKHTRRPVDTLVAAAKNATGSGVILPLVRLSVSKEGVSLSEITLNKRDNNQPAAFYPIDTISYGVQDLVYTRVFSMIVVRETAELRGQHPFECHAYVCDSRNHARRLTYALAAAFTEYSRAVRAASGGSLEGVGKRSRKFAIDLRTPEQMEKDLQAPTEEDSEA